MDFKISAVSGKKRCPICNRKLGKVSKAGEPLYVCSCGYKEAIKRYPTNNINSNQIETR